ncbi:PRC-barrel domain-containing protein [Sorangium sp. So ce1036]|uniref:PRC-barrel domain-containing protein n=1 Tax=Sorangium sp. So ce1036 TaxID=3133328 RepID=UPI003F04B2B3
MRLTYEQDVRGHSVVDAEGSVIGEVEQLYLDSESMRLAGLRIKLRSEAAEVLGVQHGLFRAGFLDVPAEAIQSLGQAVVLRTQARNLLTPPVSGRPGSPP